MSALPAADAYVKAVERCEELADRVDLLGTPRVPGTPRYLAGPDDWASAQLRLAAARRRCARELTPADADALQRLIASRPLDPAHMTDVRAIVAAVTRREGASA